MIEMAYYRCLNTLCQVRELGTVGSHSSNHLPIIRKKKHAKCRRNKKIWPFLKFIRSHVELLNLHIMTIMWMVNVYKLKKTCYFQGNVKVKHY